LKGQDRNTWNKGERHQKICRNSVNNYYVHGGSRRLYCTDKEAKVKDTDKTKKQLITELSAMRKKAARLEAAGAEQSREVSALDEKSRTKDKTETTIFREKYYELAAHNKIITSILRTFDLDERLQTILHEIMTLLNTEMGGIYHSERGETILRTWEGIPDRMRAHLLSLTDKTGTSWMASPVVLNENLSGKGNIPGFAKKEGVVSWMTVPITVSEPVKEGIKIKKRPLGILLLASRMYNALNENNMKKVLSLGEQLSLAIDHSFLYQSAVQRLSRLNVLREIDRAIMSHLSIPEIMEIVVKNVPKELGADAVAVSLIDEEDTGTTVSVMRLPNGTILEKRAFDISDSLYHWFFNRKEPVIIYDLVNDPRVQLHKKLIQKSRLSSYLGVPLVVKKRTIGILHIMTVLPKVFAPEDIDFFQTLAGQAAIALQSARFLLQALESKKKYQDIFNNATEGIFQITEGGNFLLVNPALAEILGYSSSREMFTIISTIHQLFINQQERNAFNALLQKRGNIKRCESKMFKKDGSTIDVLMKLRKIRDKNRRVLHVEGILGDITDRKRLENALRESEEKYRTIFELAGDAFITAAGPDGDIVDANKAAEKMLGYSKEELKHLSGKDIIAPEVLEDVFLKMRTQVEQTGRFFLETTYVRKNGKRVPVEESGKAFELKGKTLFQIIARDITARIKAEKEREKLFNKIKKLNAELEEKVQERTEKLAGALKKAEDASAVKSRFLSHMSHELRTPLNAVIGFSDILREQYFGTLNQKQMEYVQYISDSGRHLLSLINDILDLSKVESGMMFLDISDFAVRDLIDQSIVMIKEECLKKKINLSTAIPEDIEGLVIKADSRKLKQILHNLLSNAVKFTGEGGQIDVSVQKKKNELFISVSDTGAGIAPENQEKIFEEFYQVLEQGTTPGTGLGLPLAKQLVEMHNGKIWVESEGRGTGSRFNVALPLSG